MTDDTHNWIDLPEQPENRHAVEALARWTLPMTMAWILWGRMGAVRGACDDHCRANGKDPQTLSDVLNKAARLSDTEDPSLKPRLYFVDAQTKLWQRLEAEALIATGFEPAGTLRIVISPDQWRGMNYEDPPAGRPNSIGTQFETRYHNVTVPREDVLKLWPKEKPATAKRGRKRKVAPNIFEETVISLMDKNGEFDPDNPAWNAQARLVEALIADFTKYQGDDSAVPDRTNIIRKLPAPLAKWREMNEKRD